MGNNLYSNLVNFYNVNDENFKEFMSEIYKQMLTTHRDVQYVKEHLTEEIEKKLEIYLVDGKFNINIEEKVNEFLEDNQEIKNIISKLTTNTNNIENITSQLDTIAKKSVISFCFDDGYVEDDLTYSIFKEYGLPCSFALITDYANVRNGFDKYRDYSEKGFSINSHSSTHAKLVNDSSTIEDAYYELVNSKLLLNKLGFNANGFVASNSAVHEKYMKLVKENYDYAFTVSAGRLSTSNKGYCDKNTNVHRLYRVSLTLNSLESIKQCIDECVVNNGCLFFYDHRTGYDDGTSHVTEAKLREILTYVKSKQDNNECLVLNNDDAVSYFYNLNLKEYKTSITTNNIAPNLNEVLTSVNYGYWMYDDHNTNTAMEYNSTYEKGEYTGKLTYPNGMKLGVNSSFQTRIKVDEYNMLNNPMCFAIDLSVSENEAVDIYLEASYHDESGIIKRYRKLIDVNTKKSSHQITITPAQNSLSYVKFYFRAIAKKDITNNFTIDIGDVKIGFNNNRTNVSGKALDYKNIGVNYAKTLTPPALINKSWLTFTCPDFENNFFKGLDENGTFIIKKDGLYNIGINTNFKIENAASGFNRLIVRVTHQRTSNEDAYRNIQYFNTPNDVVSFLTSNIFSLLKGDIVKVDLFIDTNDGTVTLLGDAMLKFECIS